MKRDRKREGRTCPTGRNGEGVEELFTRRSDAGSAADLGGGTFEDEAGHLINDFDPGLRLHRRCPIDEIVSSVGGERWRGNVPANDLEPVGEGDGDDTVQLCKNRDSGRDEGDGESSIVEEGTEDDLRIHWGQYVDSNDQTRGTHPDRLSGG